MKHNELTHEIIGAAIAVHRELGPGKPEAAYEHALAHELGLRAVPHQTQRPVPVVYKGVKLECGYRLDLLAADLVVGEVKAVDSVHPVHRAQVLTYLKLGGWKVALLINFNVAVLKDGIERFVMGLKEEGCGVALAQPIPATRAIASPVLLTGRDCGDLEAERVAREIIDAAVVVHRALGSGLLPSAYEMCLCHELHLRGVPFERKSPLPLKYKGHLLPEADEVKLLVAGRVVVNPCAVPSVEALHEADLLSQLRIGGWPLGLLINFHTIHLADGIRRIVVGR